MLFLCWKFIATNHIIDEGAENFEYYTNGEGKAVITKYIGKEKEIIIPNKLDGHTVIAIEHAFYNNSNIEKVVFGDGIETIGQNTFYGCVNLKNVVLSKTVNRLESFAFAYSGLKKIKLVKGINYIGEYCFYNCDNLTFIDGRTEKLYIGKYAMLESGLKVMLIKNKPCYADNTFPRNCKFSYNYIRAICLSNKYMAPICNYVLKITIIERAFLCVIILFIICVLLTFLWLILRIISIKRGRNLVTNYKKYSYKCFEQIPDYGSHSFMYLNKIVFIRDKVKKVIIYMMLMLFIVVYLTGFVIIDFSLLSQVKYSYGKAILISIIVFGGYVFFTWEILKLILKTMSYITEKCNLAHCSPIRIIKLKNRRQMNDK